MAVTHRHPQLRLTLLEKESDLATHQTGHNSGVIHSGIYYAPGSLKAALCVRGARALVEFCQAHGIRVERCGKAIVATTPAELPRLETLYRRGQANGVPDVTLMDAGQLREVEPHAAGLKALHVPSTAIVNFRQVAQAYAEVVRARGGTIVTSATALKIVSRSDRLIVHTTAGEFSARFVITCGGLHADRLARMADGRETLRIVPFRGEYYELIPARRHLVRGLIYPVPDPRLPFLGAHLTRTVDGRVEAGPNAVLALKREGYRKTDLNLEDVAELLRFGGFWRMAARHWRTGLAELSRSLCKPAFVRAIQRLVPAIQAEDVVSAGSGVRAQAVDSGGRLLDDFQVIRRDRMLHVCNAPSPAATASLAIGEFVAEMAATACGWLRR